MGHPVALQTVDVGVANIDKDSIEDAFIHPAMEASSLDVAELAPVVPGLWRHKVS